MTGIMYGHAMRKHNLGTVYGNYTLDSAATGINVFGSGFGGSGGATITLPAAPSTNQTVVVNNTGSGTVTVSNGTTIAAGQSAWFIWGGYTWGVVIDSNCAGITLPSTHDFGTAQYAGPSETPYSVPATTVTYSTLGYTPCGGQVRKITTKTYSARSVAAQWKAEYGGGGSISVTPFNGSFIHIGYGSSQFQSADTYFQQIYSEASPTCTYFGTPATKVRADVYISSASSVVYQVQGGGEIAGISCNIATSQLTLYYLDVHEVWTYDVI
jgi:hypothetical protein